jgi:hypothetical protein
MRERACCASFSANGFERELSIFSGQAAYGGAAGDEGFTARWHHAVESGPIMSKWQEEKAEKNRRSLARLNKGLPRIFPSAVLSRALGRPFVPPTPRLAIDSYWGAHPLRADRLARALAARSGPPTGWSWRLGDDRKDKLPVTFRTPPAPYRERAFSRGPGFCCVCGQPVYRFGWHVDLWNAGINKNAMWHCACVIAWQFWTAPSDQVRLLRRLQGRRCGETGGRLWKSAEVDHCIPLFRVWSEYRDAPWPALLDYLGLAKPSGDQSRCPRRKVRDRGAAPTRRAQFNFA